jgi:hypothetical protein
LEIDPAFIGGVGGFLIWEEQYDSGEGLATSVGEAEAGDGMEAILVSDEFFEGKSVKVSGDRFDDKPVGERVAGGRLGEESESSNLELGPSG